jgi:hypothetical protein
VSTVYGAHNSFRHTKTWTRPLQRHDSLHARQDPILVISVMTAGISALPELTTEELPSSFHRTNKSEFASNSSLHVVTTKTNVNYMYGFNDLNSV